MGDREENHMEKVMEKVRVEITGKSHGQNPLHSQAKRLYHTYWYILNGGRSKFPFKWCISLSKDFFIIANSKDPGDMSPHLDLHSLYLFIGIQN